MKSAVLLLLLLAPAATFAAADDAATIAALDTQYQAAVLKKDIPAMDRLLAPDFVLVNGKGREFSKAQLLADTSRPDLVFIHQEDTRQSVHVWGDTATVTALLHVAGTDHGQAFDYTLWFSDVYLRTPKGWRYTFGQASLHLPAAAAAKPAGQ